MKLKNKNANAESSAETGRVMIHASPIGFISDQFVLRFTKPMPKIAPISTCVEEIGSPSTDAAMTTTALASSALTPEAA